VIEHLVNTIASYNGRDKALYAEIVRSTYAELARMDDAATPAVVLEALRERGVTAWVWHGDGFAPVDRVVFVAPSFMDLRPFVYGVPGELQPFTDLLVSAGVTQTARLVDVLNKVHDHRRSIFISAN